MLGCGYRPLGGNLVLGPDVQQLEIRMFENSSDEPGLELVIGEALMEEFMRGGRLRAVPAGESGGSQVVLSGVIQRVYVRPSSFSSVAISVEDSLEVTVNASVLRVDTGEVLWQGFGLSAPPELPLQCRPARVQEQQADGHAPGRDPDRRGHSQ